MLLQVFWLVSFLLNAPGARFEFSLDEDLKKAAMDSEVKAAIAEKISRERIGHEVFLWLC